MKNDKICLKSVNVSGNVIGEFGLFEVEQVIINNSEKNSEMPFFLQMKDTATIIGFDIYVGEKHLQGKCVDSFFEIEEDNEDSDDRVYSYSTNKKNQIYIYIGNIHAYETIKIKIRYIDKFYIKADKLKVVLPVLETIEKKSDDYIAKLYINVDKNLNYKDIKSKMNDIDVVERKEFTELEIKNYDISNECEIEVELSNDVIVSAMTTDTVDNNKVLELSFMYKFLEKCKDSKNEYIFMIDLSINMSENALEQLKEVILECLKKLKYGDKFNILTYSDDFRAMELESIEYNEENFEKAKSYIKELELKSSVTSIYELFRFALYEKDVNKNLLLFSYRKINEDNSIIDFLEENIIDNRVFTFGIDYGEDKYFIKKIAEAGRGKASFINSNNYFKENVIEIFEKIQNPFLEDLKIDYGKNKVLKEFGIKKALFNYEFYTVFVKLEKIEDDIKIGGKILDKEYIWTISKENIKKSNCNLGILLEVKEIEELEEGIRERREESLFCEFEKEIKEISKKYNIPSKYTKFIIVYEKNGKLIRPSTYKKDLDDYEEIAEKEEKRGKLKKFFVNLFNKKEKEDDFYDGFLGDDMLEEESTLDKIFKKRKNKDDEEIGIEYVQEKINKYYEKFINQSKEKSILTYILLAIYYFNFLHSKNKFKIDKLVIFFKENKDEILNNELYQKLLCVLFKGIINENISEKEGIYNLLNQNYKKALDTKLKMSIGLEKISEEEYEKIIKKDLDDNNIDKVLIKICWIYIGDNVSLFDFIKGTNDKKISEE